MDIAAITHIAFQTFGKKAHRHREVGHTFFHGQRVAKLAVSLRQAIFPDDPSHDEVIYVGALFHDVEKGNEPHNETGARVVQQLLRDHCRAAELSAIAEVVRLHNQRGMADDPFVKLVQDADMLDHEGTLGLWLLFVVTASIGESVPDAIDFWQKHRTDDDREPDLNYHLSKQIFRERRRYYNSVMERLSKEANGQIVWPRPAFSDD